MSLQALTAGVGPLSDSNPPWLDYPPSHLRGSLSILRCDELRAASSHVCEHISVWRYYDKSCIDNILDHFNSCRLFFLTCDLTSLHSHLRELNLKVTGHVVDIYSNGILLYSANPEA